MFKILLFSLTLLLVGCVSEENTQNKNTTEVQKDMIGKFYLGLSEKVVKQEMECPVTYGEDELWGVDDLYHQNWNYSDCGISFDMTSSKKGGEKLIESITIEKPSRLKTDKGIGIGSTEQEVMKVYQSRWSKGESRPDMFVVDSIFGGILIYFEDGKVERIFVGAAAE